jgi:hypothetical protein
MNMGVVQYRHSNSDGVPRMFYSDANIDFYPFIERMNMGVAQYRHSNSGVVPRMFYSDANIDSLSIHQKNGEI